MIVALWTSTPTSMTVVATSTSTSPAAKARIVASFSSAAIRPCRPRTRRPASGPSPSSASISSTAARGGWAAAAVHRHRVAVLVEVGLVVPALLELVAGDARAHDVDLVALVDLLAHPLPDPGDPPGVVEQVDDVGLDRRPTRRELGERGGLEVAEDGHRHGARDRGRRHDQHVGRAAGGLVGERRTLLDAEAVLLVDDDEPEVGELDLVLEQRVGADHDAGLAAGQARHRGGALGLGHRPGQQLDGGALGGATQHPAGGEVAEQGGDRAVVLLGEHLGRRQQRGLAAGVDDAQHRAQRDEGLAGPDLALEQPVHRVRSGQVGVDLGPDLALAVGQRERQPRVERRQQRAVAPVARHRAQGAHRATPARQHELGDQRLLEAEVALRAGDLLERLGRVDPVVGAAHVDEPVGLRAPAPGSARAGRRPPSGRRSPPAGGPRTRRTWSAGRSGRGRRSPPPPRCRRPSRRRRRCRRPRRAPCAGW